MLLELSISNFAIIDQLRLRLGEHLNVFTGETGAGKSILVDAVSALVGERTGADAVRAGAERAVIEGIVEVSALLAAPASDADQEAEAGSSLAATLADLGIAPEDGTLILTREITSGHSPESFPARARKMK